MQSAHAWRMSHVAEVSLNCVGVHARRTQNHKQLHHDTGSQESIAVDVPHPTARLGSRDVDVEQLVLVLPLAASQTERSRLATTEENQKTMHAPMATSGASGA